MAFPRYTRIFITGRPGVGKSTLFNVIVEHLKDLGCRIGGISAPEVRHAGRRVGFLLVDLMTGEKVTLASVHLKGRLRVGKYTVNSDAGAFGSQAIIRALNEADVVAIDEIGPMELLLEELKKAIIDALTSTKPLIAVIHAKLIVRDPSVYKLIVGKGLLIELTEFNRNAHRLKAGEYAEILARNAGCLKR